MSQNTDSFNKFLTHSWDALQERIVELEKIAKDLREKGHEEEGLETMISQYKSIEKGDISPSPAEQSLYKALSSLIDEDILPESEVNEQYDQLIQGTKVQVMSDIILSLNPKAKSKWDKMIDTTPNMMQFGFALDAISQILNKKTFDQMYEEKLEQVVKSLAEQEESINEVADKVTALTDEQQVHVQKMLDMGYGEMAHNILDAYKNERE